MHPGNNATSNNCYGHIMTVPTYDIAVIGGGIAGVSAAAGAAPTHSVVLLEQENELAYHTTSRSAAVYIENEGGPVFHRLSTASRPFYDHSPGSDTPFVTPLGVLKVGDDSFVDAFAEEVAEASTVTPSIRLIQGEELLEICPALDLDVITVAMYEPTGGAIDVMGVHQQFLRNARAAGAEVRRSARLNDATRVGDHWELQTEAGPIHAGVIINAGGAWGDVVAESCGVEAVGLQPKRRTAFTSTIGMDQTGWPLVYSAIPEYQCYFKPEAGNQLLCSLSDEQDSEPCDARPEEIDIALAIDRINTISTVGIRSVATTWAGLRTFAPDRNPVFGWDDQAEGFLWMVGQGGCGIVTSPIASDIVGTLVRDEPLPERVTELGLSKSDLAPRR
jgi:D-arginine dehydrogenase